MELYLVDNIVNRLAPILVTIEYFNIKSTLLNIRNIYICKITICSLLLPIHYEKIYMKKTFIKEIQYASIYHENLECIFKYPRNKSQKVKRSIIVIYINLIRR